MEEMLRFENRHWRQERYDYPQARHAFSQLWAQMGNKLVLSLEGPRRTGKTVLMKQLINRLIEKGVKPKDILFHSFDETPLDPLKVLKAYETLREEPLGAGKPYLFFDEIERLSEWQSFIKMVYDSYPNIKMVISGSTLCTSRKESLAGRMLSFIILPLSFPEYLFFRKKTGLADGDEDAYCEEYQRYLSRQYPDLALDSGIEPQEYVNSVAGKVIFEDSRYEGLDTELLSGIFRVIVRDPGQIIDYTDLAKDFGAERKSVSACMDFLVRSRLVRKVYNYMKNARKMEIASKKFYPFCTTLLAYSSGAEPGKVAECDAAFQLSSQYFHSSRSSEIDFLLPAGKKLYAFEVKSGRHLDRSDVRGLFSAQAEKLGITKRYAIIGRNSVLRFSDPRLHAIRSCSLWKFRFDA